MANEIERLKSSIAKLTDDQLWDELQAALTTTAEGLARMAVIWRELESRGHDLSSLRKGMGVYLPEIAAGRLTPEAVIKYADSKTALNIMRRMNIRQQKALLDGGKVPVVRYTGKDFQRLDIALDDIAGSIEMRLVFDDRGRIRDHQAQEKILRRRHRKHNAAAAEPSALVRLENGDRLRVGDSVVDRRDVLAALATKVPDVPLESPEVFISLGMSRSQAKALQAHAQESGLGVQDMIKASLKMAGVFDRLADDED